MGAALWVGMAVAALEVRVGDVCGGWVDGWREGVRPRGVQDVVSEVGVVGVWSLEGLVRGV